MSLANSFNVFLRYLFSNNVTAYETKFNAVKQKLQKKNFKNSIKASGFYFENSEYFN